jgi:hypothetical protein
LNTPQCVAFTVIAVFFSVLQRYIIPVVSSVVPPNYVDIVTIQARIPDTISVSDYLIISFSLGNEFMIKTISQLNTIN